MKFYVWTTTGTHVCKKIQRTEVLDCSKSIIKPRKHAISDPRVKPRVDICPLGD